jgi:hypothetical protein
MFMFNLHIPDSAPTYYDDLGALDYQVKTISTTSLWLLDYNESWVTLFHEEGTNANVPVGSRLRVGLLSAAIQHADPLPKPVFCVHCVAASKL